LNPELRRFAEGIRRDEAAVLAAVTEQWSNGPVEGHINRLKTVKRQMYGRAGFVLLRARGADSIIESAGEPLLRAYFQQYASTYRCTVARDTPTISAAV